MKISQFAWSTLMLGLTCVALGAEERAVESTGYVYSDYLTTSTPAATPVPPMTAAAPCGQNGCLCDSVCAPQPWTLPQPCFLQRHRIVMGGWVEQGVTFNANSPEDRFNGPVGTNDRSNDYQLNQAWLFFSRPTQTNGCGWDWGGRVDLVYGTDWRFGKCLGLEDRINSADTTYGMVIPQFYFETAYNDLTVKMGHYGARFGYEVIPAPGNFFYSHSYAMCYAQPILVTGAEADYKLSDNWLLVGGFNRGWMMFEDNNDKFDFLGGVKWTSDDKDTTFSYMVSNGAEDNAGEHNRFAYAAVFTEQVTDRFLYVLQHNLGVEQHGVVATGENATWYGLDQYLIYKLNSRWSAGLRTEWFRDENGTRVAGIGNWIGSDRGWTGAGFAGNFYEVTAGLNWRPHSNVLLRPELRWDWYDGPANSSGQLPFDDGNKDNQFLAAVDLIVTF